MADVVAGRTAIVFRIPEVLIVLERRDVVRRQVATLRRLALAERVIDLPRVPVREALLLSLQAVVSIVWFQST